MERQGNIWRDKEIYEETRRDMERQGEIWRDRRDIERHRDKDRKTGRDNTLYLAKG